MLFLPDDSKVCLTVSPSLHLSKCNPPPSLSASLYSQLLRRLRVQLLPWFQNELKGSLSKLV